MHIKSFVFNSNNVNTYIISDELSKDAIVIDCGCSSQEEAYKLSDYVENEALHIKSHICTHLHFDHVFGASLIATTYGVLTYACKLDEDILEWNKMCSIFMGFSKEERSLLDFSDYRWLNSPYSPITLGNYKFDVLHTPGHSPGSLSFYCKEKNVLFCGDVIFKNGFGRTDFEGGSKEQLNNSILQLSSLPSQTMVFPGHYEPFRIKDIVTL